MEIIRPPLILAKSASLAAHGKRREEEMAKCKHPNAVCRNMVIYKNAAYCSSDMRSLQNKNIKQTNADKIRSMDNDELAQFLAEKFCHGVGEDLVKKWLESGQED